MAAALFSSALAPKLSLAGMRLTATLEPLELAGVDEAVPALANWGAMADGLGAVRGADTGGV